MAKVNYSQGLSQRRLGLRLGLVLGLGFGYNGPWLLRTAIGRIAVPEVGCWRRRRSRRPEPERRTRTGHGRYLDVVAAAAGPLDVQLEIEDGELDRLSGLDAHSPAALGIHVVLVRVVGTGQVAAAVQLEVVAEMVKSRDLGPDSQISYGLS